MRTIWIVNKSKLVSDAELLEAIQAVQLQIDRDFAPIWGVSANLLVATEDDPTKEAILIMDDPTVADALGYHEVEPGTEVPHGYVFVQPSRDAGIPWTVPFSHEVLEELTDCFANAAVIGTWGGRPAAMALEPCDAVEQDTYTINGVAVSNFVLPTWFVEATPPGAQVDFLGLLQSPCTLRLGGYISITYNLRTWKEITFYKGTKSGYRQHPGILKYSRPSKRRGNLAVASLSRV